MKPKALLPLVVVFAVLGALVFLRQSGEETPNLVEQAELKPLVPADLDVDTVNRIEIYSGAAPSERAVLVRDGDRWRITSHYNALTNQGRAQQLLDAVKDLQGEFRATASDEQLADYDLSEDRGWHTVGFDGPERNVLFHVITGKAPKYGNMFMRAVDSSDVYVVDHNLRRDAYNYSLEWDDKPSSPAWVDKAIVQLPGDDFTRFELTMPDKSLVVEKQEKPATSAESTEGTAEEGEETPAVPAEPETEWAAIEGGRSGTIHQTPFSDLSRYIANLAAEGVVDPEKKTIWGLDNPGYQLTALRENGEKVEVTVARPTIGNPSYLIRTDNNNESIYILSDVVFSALFASGGKYYDLPGLLLEENTVKRIEFDSFDGPVKLAKVDDVWRVESPVSDLPPNKSTLESLERTLSSWQAVDYADAGVETGLADSKQSVTFGNDLETQVIRLGASAMHTEGRYAQLNDLTDNLVMAQSDVDAIFLPYNDLFDTDLYNPPVDAEIVSIQMSNAGEDTTFTLNDGTWTVSRGDDSFEAKLAEVEKLISTLDNLKSVDIQLPDKRTNGAPVGGFTITTDKDEVWSLVLQEAVDSLYPAVVNDADTANMIDERTFNRLFPDLESFRPGEGEELVTVDDEQQLMQQIQSLQAPGVDPHTGHNH